MTLLVHTARISYGGPDRFDITRKSGGPEGRVFSPSWAILGPALDARKEAKRDRDGGEASAAWYAGKTTLKHGTTETRCSTPISPARCDDIRRQAYDRADKIERDAWSDYVPAYVGEMFESRGRNAKAWEALLARETVTLVCYCAQPDRCHRTLLASMLEKLGAGYEGEVS